MHRSCTWPARDWVLYFFQGGRVSRTRLIKATNVTPKELDMALKELEDNGQMSIYKERTGKLGMWTTWIGITRIST